MLAGICTGHTLAEVAAWYGLSSERIRQLSEHRASVLRKRLKGELTLEWIWAYNNCPQSIDIENLHLNERQKAILDRVLAGNPDKACYTYSDGCLALSRE